VVVNKVVGNFSSEYVVLFVVVVNKVVGDVSLPKLTIFSVNKLFANPGAFLLLLNVDVDNFVDWVLFSVVNLVGKFGVAEKTSMIGLSIDSIHLFFIYVTCTLYLEVSFLLENDAKSLLTIDESKAPRRTNVITQGCNDNCDVSFFHGIE
jgi:hypothetical protein